MENWGNVYIPFKSESDDDNNPFGGAVFSNLHFRWYTPDGNLHPEMDHYIQHEFWLRSQVTSLNREGQKESYTLQLLLPPNFKTVTYSGPTSDYFDKFCRLEREMAEKYGLLDASDAKELSRFSRSQGVVSFLLSDRRPALTTTLPLFIAMWTHADDLIDESDDLASSAVISNLRQLSYTQLREILKPLLNAGMPSVSNKDFNKPETLSMNSKNFSRFQRFLKGMSLALQDWRKEAIHFANGEINASALLSTLHEMYEANVFEICAESQRSSQTVNSVLNVRTCGILMIVETAALLEGVILSHELRSNFLFRWWRDQVATHACKVNDLLSYPKERMMGQGKQVYTLHMTPGGLPLQEAVNKVQAEANQCMRNVVDGAVLLRDTLGKGEEGKALEKYMELGMHVIVATLQWVGCHPRYHKNGMVWDCVVKRDLWNSIKHTLPE